MEYLLAARWLVLYGLLALAALPVASALFPRFPDRGAALALPVALATIGLAGFWAGHVTLGPLLPPVAVAALLVPTALALRRGVEVDLRGYAGAMAVFSVAFALLLAVRAVDPAIVAAGGEKFLDFGLLQSVLRADSLPPEDVWFAGEPVRYYYGASALAALLARLAFTPPEFAYNLALAGFYATLVTAAYGLAGAMAARSGRSSPLAGLLGAFLAGLAGTLATPGRLLLGHLPDPLAARYGHLLLDGIRVPYEEALSSATAAGTYSFWWGRYVVPDTVHLFPMWAFRNGDLNAYMVATPFLLTVAACAYAYYRTPESDLLRRRLLVFGVVPAAAGHLTTVSTWSLPTAVGLTWLALTFADARPATLLPASLLRRLDALGSTPGRPGVESAGRRETGDTEQHETGGSGRSETDGAEHPATDGSGRSGADDPGRPEPTRLGQIAREAGRTGLAALLAVAAGALAVAWASPYLLFHTPVNRGIGLLPPRSGLGGLLLVYGALLGAFVLYLAPRILGLVPNRSRWTRVADGLVLVALVALLAFVLDLAAVALLGPFLVGGWLLLRLDADVGFETVLLVAGCGMLLVVEFAYARVWPFDPNAPRWNTVYKVSMQVWVLWGAAAAAALARLLGGHAATVRERVVAGGWYRPVAAVVAALLVVASATFPVLALADGLAPAVEEPGSLTLDGTRYVEVYHPEEAAAIDWLADRPGQPTMVSRPGEEMYTWKNGPASLTGVPTLAGWKHEEGYRGEAAYRSRVEAVRVVYTAPWPAVRPVLDEHDVELVYLGPNERERYGARDFSRYPGITTAFEGGNVTIYRVNQSALGG